MEDQSRRPAPAGLMPIVLVPGDCKPGSNGQGDRRCRDGATTGQRSLIMTSAWMGAGRMGGVAIIVIVAVGPACEQKTYGRTGHRPTGRYHHDSKGHHLSRSRSRCSTSPPAICHTHRRSRHARGPCGHYVRQWVPPLYEVRHYPCGTPYTVRVRGGYYCSVWVATPICAVSRRHGHGFHYRYRSGGIHLYGHLRF